MSVYVDRAKNKLGRMKMSHMLADSLEELHEIAEKVGLKREWFQENKTPHYDLCQSKRKLAIKLGAIDVNNRELVQIIYYWREKKSAQLMGKSDNFLCPHSAIDFYNGNLWCLDCNHEFSSGHVPKTT